MYTYKSIGFLVIVFVVGFLFGTFTTLPVLDEQLQTIKTSATQNIPGSGAGDNSDRGQETNTQTQTGGGTVIPTNALTDAQKKMLGTLGVDTESLVVTEAMITCAAEKLGAGRIEEIKNGATPSFLEGASLLSCYSQ